METDMEQHLTNEKNVSGGMNKKKTIQKLLDIHSKGDILAYWSRDFGSNRYSHNKITNIVQALFSIIPDIPCQCAHIFMNIWEAFFTP